VAAGAFERRYERAGTNLKLTDALPRLRLSSTSRGSVRHTQLTSAAENSMHLVAQPLMTTTTHPASKSDDVLHSAEELHQINPLEDSRWDGFVDRHPRASLFHSSAWLRAIRTTYGYQPAGFTWSAPFEKLRGAILFCEVNSWLTGKRLVSLPFSDHCEPLMADDFESRELLQSLEKRLSASDWSYIEVRPLKLRQLAGPDWRDSANYFFHELDLRPDLATLFRNFHRSCAQRKIRRAEREGLVYREGASESFLDKFYRLLVITRKRHYIPPQPRIWFRNLMNNFGDALKIRLVFKGDQAVAGMLTIRHKGTLYYKNGGSDARFHHLGGMHLLFWNSIQDAKDQGLTTLDFGRVDADQPGLITFKERWGATSSPLHYYRFSPGKSSVHAFDPASKLQRRAISKFCSLSPACVLPICGSLLYKHIG